jgi:YegS/Rv2252/BmrU family lipid kinase
MLHIIVNPNCGSGQGKTSWKTLKKLLNLAKVTYIPHITSSASDVTRTAKSVTDPALFENNAVNNELLVLGGDGTMNHCINGIADLAHTNLTYLPSGTSNDLSRALQIACDPIDAVRTAQKKTGIRSIDLGNVRFGTKKKRFAVSAGIGYDAAVCHEALRSPVKAFFNRLGLGKLIYGLIALKQFLFLQPCGCTLYVEGQDPVRFETFLLAAFMNLKYEGGGFPFAPDADPSDGMLDVLVVGDLPKWKVPFLLPSVLKGQMRGKSGVFTCRTDQIRIVTDRPLCCHTDGEIIGNYKELTLQCGKEKLNLKL